MRAAIPHQLGREEVRRRLRERSHELADAIPGGMAQVQREWVGEDQLNLNVRALGQEVVGSIEIEDHQVVLDFTLPPALSFLTPAIEGAVKSQGQKLLAED